MNQEDDDIWGEDIDNRQYEQQMHQRDMNKLQDDLHDMGFREGMIYQSDEIVKKNYLNGVHDAFEQYQVVGYARGKAFLIRNLLGKFAISQEVKENILKKVDELENEKIMLEKNEKDIDTLANSLLELIFAK